MQLLLLLRKNGKMQTSPIPFIAANNAPEIMVAKALVPPTVPLSAAVNAHEGKAFTVGAGCHPHPEGPTHPEGFVTVKIGITIKGKLLKTVSPFTLAVCK